MWLNYLIYRNKYRETENETEKYVPKKEDLRKKLSETETSNLPDTRVQCNGHTDVH